MTDVLVVGGGASGLMAAGVAAARGHRVTVLERNREVGRKLHISGKGRCNITNDTDLNGLLANIPGNPRFLRHAFHRFTPQDVMAFFEHLGVAVKTERGGRVFPVSDDADDVVRALRRHCDAHGVTIRPDTLVKSLEVRDGAITGVRLDDAVLPVGAVILATGGASYPGTGSRGDGYRMAREVGHTVLPIHPSLVPLVTEERWPADAQGLSLRNVTLTAFSPDGKRLYRELGEMLFTHYGVSGPLVLSASRHVGELPGSRLEIDLKPALDDATLDARVQRDFAALSRKQFGNALDELLPRTLIPIIIDLVAIPPDTPVHQITREQRRRLVHLLKHLTVTVKGTRSMAEAIITAGGVCVREIDPTTMQSKLVHGLFFTGEVIDVDAYTGGYNLQIAWSTGHLAGESV
jgi:predicted Rossmann fold flavoprotein